MKFFPFSKAIIAVFAIILLSFGWYFSCKTYATFAVNRYMEAQGLKQEDILEDSGLSPAWDVGWFCRDIRFKKNPDYVYHYLVRMSITNIFDYLANKNNVGYLNVSYGSDDFDEYKNKDGKESANRIQGGQLDKNGVLIKDFIWRDKK